MTKTKCDLYDKIKQDAIWLVRHIVVFYGSALSILFLFFGGDEATTWIAVKLAFAGATVDVLIRARRYFLGKQ